MLKFLLQLSKAYKNEDSDMNYMHQASINTNVSLFLMSSMFRGSRMTNVSPFIMYAEHFSNMPWMQ